ncbi:hypothetical protein [Pseudoalteromonas virus vB_PspP-H6/1]|nr:hypothetical protein [Pseudoalteromonas virus vB_PspP-H6/1]
MKINQAELDEAIETISEGGEALGVSCDDVYRDMLKIDSFAMTVMAAVHSKSEEGSLFSDEFLSSARAILLEALRAKMENDSGL